MVFAAAGGGAIGKNRSSGGFEVEEFPARTVDEALAIIENQAYAHTFALFLQKENEAEREEFLLELGISGTEVDAISARIGVVREEERRLHLRWYSAILPARSAGSPTLDLEDLVTKLRITGLPVTVADRLVALGGGEEVRRETGENSALRLLSEAGTDIRALHKHLCEAGDAALDIRDARNTFFRWLDTNRRRLAAVLATKLPQDVAKRKARSPEPPTQLSLAINPALPRVLGPIVEVLRDANLPADANRLANSPEEELAHLGDFGTVSELDASVELLYDEEETRRILRDCAARWRAEIRLLAVLSRTGPSATRTSIREIYGDVEAKLPINPSSPAKLRNVAVELLVARPELARLIEGNLVDSLNALPNRDELMQMARQDGVAVDRLRVVQQALDKPREEQVRDLRDRSQRLAQRAMRPTTPEVLKRDDAGNGHEADNIAPGGDEGRNGGGNGKVPVAPIKVGEGHDAHKRKLGDEGERWALASVVGILVKLDREERNAAIDEIVALLRRFEGAPVNDALSHEVPARRLNLDEEELIDELSGLLHVSQYSDAFGFDLIGWLPSVGNGKGRAVCLEVKSSGGEGFRLSRKEWATSERFHNDGLGDRYAVLVVLRSKGGGVPAAMHLLSNPVNLEKSGRLRMEADGYQIVYQTNNP